MVPYTCVVPYSNAFIRVISEVSPVASWLSSAIHTRNAFVLSPSQFHRKSPGILSNCFGIHRSLPSVAGGGGGVHPSLAELLSNNIQLRGMRSYWREGRWKPLLRIRASRRRRDVSVDVERFCFALNCVSAMTSAQTHRIRADRNTRTDGRTYVGLRTSPALRSHRVVTDSWVSVIGTRPTPRSLPNAGDPYMEPGRVGPLASFY